MGKRTPSTLLKRVRYVGRHAGRKVTSGFQEIQFLADGQALVLPSWEAERLVEEFDDLEIVEDPPAPRRRKR